jgi:predicted nuclease with TOPRIM domain
VTCDKIFAIKEAKRIFDDKVAKLIMAQEYELVSQETQAIRSAQEVFVDQGNNLLKHFNIESQMLHDEYHKLHGLIKYYEEQMKSLQNKVCLQETIIFRLQNYLSQ